MARVPAPAPASLPISPPAAAARALSSSRAPVGFSARCCSRPHDGGGLLQPHALAAHPRAAGWARKSGVPAGACGLPRAARVRRGGGSRQVAARGGGRSAGRAGAAGADGSVRRDRRRGGLRGVLQAGSGRWGNRRRW